MNKRIVNGEAEAFLVVFAGAGLMIGLYTLLGRFAWYSRESSRRRPR